MLLRALSQFMRPREAKGWQRAFVCALIAQFLVIAGLAASPHLHQLLHHDADQSGHECVVTVMLSGGSDDVAPPAILVQAPLPADSLASLLEFSPNDVAALFLTAHIFEHAPPAVA
jgi:hypothetical protein